MRGTVKDTAAGSNATVQNPMVLRRLRVDWAVEATRKINDNQVESLSEEEATVHAVTTDGHHTGKQARGGKGTRNKAGILIWEKLRTPEITSSVPVDGLCTTDVFARQRPILASMSTAGRCTKIRHTSQVPLLMCSRRAKGKRQTENDGKGRDLASIGQRVKRH